MLPAQLCDIHSRVSWPCVEQSIAVKCAHGCLNIVEVGLLVCRHHPGAKAAAWLCLYCMRARCFTDVRSCCATQEPEGELQGDKLLDGRLVFRTLQLPNGR